MSKKESFAKLTEGLDKLNEEQVEKSEDKTAENTPEVNVVEPPSSVQEFETVQPQTEKEEEAAKEEDESKDKEPETDEEKEEAKKAEEAEKPKEDEAKLEPQDAVKPEVDAAKDKEEPKEEDKKEEDEKEEVEKSASTDLSEADIVGAFEAIHKSYGTILKELQELRQYVSENLVKSEPKAQEEGAPEPDKPVAEKPASEEAKEEEAKKEEEQDEEVEKSAKDEENVEGKTVDYVSKSNGVPEIEAEEEAPEEEAEFNPREHVNTVADYFYANAANLSQGQRSTYRSAVQRVKRNAPTPDDVELFRQVVAKKEN